MKKLAALTVLAIMLFAIPALAQPRNDNFFVTVGAGNVLQGGGSGYNDGAWYVYPSMWINQWFYDHPFDASRGKIIHVEFDWAALDPLCPTDLTVAINWSTGAWSALGNTYPPLPGVDEAMYIERATILYECGYFTGTNHFALDFTIFPYNPEWVSIDVRGCNFVISNGIMLHDCVVGTETSSWGAIKELFR